MSKTIKYNSQSIAFIAIVLGFVVIVNYVVMQAFFRVDLTENKEYSISPATKHFLKKLDDIINIKVYFSKDLPPNLKKLETDVHDIISEYKAYGGKNIRVTFEDPARNEETKSKVRALGIPEIQMQSFEKDKAQVSNGFLGIVVLYLDKKEVLPVVQDLSKLEYDLTQAIMKVSRTSTPKVGILKTDTSAYLPERVAQRMNIQARDNTEEKYKPIFQALQENYSVETVDISEGQQISSEIKTLIVPGGDDAGFTDRKLFEIDQFFMKGGKLIVLADAVKINFQNGVNGMPQSPKILQLLEHYGARVENDMVLDASCGQVQIPQRFGQFSMNVPVPYPYFVRIVTGGFDKNNPAVASQGELVLPWASSITLLVNKQDSTGRKPAGDTSSTRAVVLVHSSEKSWTAAGNFDLNPQQKWVVPPQNQLKEHNLAVYLSGHFSSYFAGKSVPPVKTAMPGDSTPPTIKPEDAGREIVASTTDGNLVVVGESDFVTAQNATPQNSMFVLNLVDWFTQDESLITVRTRNVANRTMQNDMLKEGSSMPMVIRLINVFLMPAIMIAIGLAIYFRRREKTASPVA
jgi:gliding-associated putative ABC transporter substrate-binding component GldG